MKSEIYPDMHTTRSVAVLVLVGLLGVGLTGPAPAWAQETDPGEADSSSHRADPGGGGFFAIGVHAAEIDPLNERFRGAGYPTFPSEMIAVGGGGYGVVAHRLLLGGEGYGLIAPSRGYQGREISVGGGYGLFTVGYRFRLASELRAYPQVGVGGGGLSVEIASAGSERFEDVLENPNRSATLEKGSFLISLGVGLEYRFRMSEKRNGFQIGLRAGYLLAPYESDWQLDNSQLSGGPDATLDGPFLRLLIGGWGGEASKK